MKAFAYLTCAAAGLIAVALGLIAVGLAYAQTQPFKPSENPVVNQAYNAVAVTPSNTATIPVTRALYTGGTGAGAACSMLVVLNGGTQGAFVTFANVQPGEILPVQAIQVGTASTCTAILALY